MESEFRKYRTLRVRHILDILEETDKFLHIEGITLDRWTRFIRPLD